MRKQSRQRDRKKQQEVARQSRVNPKRFWSYVSGKTTNRSNIGDLTRSSADADNRLDAFSGQSRSTNMVPFHMLHIVSYCAIVTLCLRCAVFTIFVFKKFHDLEMGVKGH